MNLLTVNLEKKMISGNSLSKQEQLVFNEHRALREKRVNPDVLARIGMTHIIDEGNKVVDQINTLAKYEQSRVFHIDQIEKICKKYDLRFLPCQYYKGNIDPLLTERVEGFEKQYNFRPQSGKQRFSNDYYSNYHIAAPKSSFSLQERPKDPLFFAKIGDNHWYLVHKWGKDLSITRRIKTFLHIDGHSWISFVVFSVLAFFAILIINHPTDDVFYNVSDKPLFHAIVRNTIITCFILAIIANIIQYRSGLSKWNSKFKD